MKKYLVPIALAALGVVAGGLLIKYGRENDVPILTQAADGFDN